MAILFKNNSGQAYADMIKKGLEQMGYDRNDTRANLQRFTKPTGSTISNYRRSEWLYESDMYQDKGLTKE